MTLSDGLLDYRGVNGASSSVQSSCGGRSGEITDAIFIFGGGILPYVPCRWWLQGEIIVWVHTGHTGRQALLCVL